MLGIIPEVSRFLDCKQQHICSLFFKKLPQIPWLKHEVPSADEPHIPEEKLEINTSSVSAEVNEIK